MAFDEVMNVIWPQLFQVSEETLSVDNPPPLLNLSRACMEDSGIYVIFNTFNVYIFVGNTVDSFYLDLLFGVQTLEEISNVEISEEEVFFGPVQEAKAWVQELYAIIQSLRISHLIYPEFKVLFQMDQRSEIILKELMLEDATKGYDFNNIKRQLTSQSNTLAMPY